MKRYDSWQYSSIGQGAVLHVKDTNLVFEQLLHCSVLLKKKNFAINFLLHSNGDRIPTVPTRNTGNSKRIYPVYNVLNTAKFKRQQEIHCKASQEN